MPKRFQIISILLLLTMPMALMAQETDSDDVFLMDVVGEIREFVGSFENRDELIIVRLPDMDAGDTIYVYAAGTGTVNTYIYVMDARQRRIFAEDDNGGGGTNSALSYEFTDSGDYTLGLRSIGSLGNYQLRLGINTPDLLDILEQPLSAPADLEPFDCADANLGDRPNISGRERQFEADSFVIHYSLTGVDETDEEWVEVLAEAIEFSLDVQLNDLGWALPPADCGEGGDGRLDVYVVDMSNSPAIGIASPENVVGDNPNTEAIETYAAYSYLLIENDLEYINSRREAYNLLRTVAAHEIHHNIQFGYDVNDRFFSFYEAGATWIESLVYPELSEGLGEDARPVFENPDLCYSSYTNRETNDWRIYGEWLTIDSFTRDLGMESYQFIWEKMAVDEGLPAFYTALEELGTSPEEVVLRTAVRNLLWDYEVAEYFDNSLKVDIETTASSIGFVSPEVGGDGVEELGVDYIHLTEMETYTINLEDGDGLELYAVGVDRRADTARLYELGQGGTVDFSDYNTAYIIVLNTNRHTSTSNCHETDWIIQLLDGEGEELVQPTDEIWNAEHFIVAR
jgi:hypothetical protein